LNEVFDAVRGLTWLVEVAGHVVAMIGRMVWLVEAAAVIVSALGWVKARTRILVLNLVVGRSAGWQRVGLALKGAADRVVLRVLGALKGAADRVVLRVLGALKGAASVLIARIVHSFKGRWKFVRSMRFGGWK